MMEFPPFAPLSQTEMDLTHAPSLHHCEEWTGIIQRITFHNAESGWTVLKVSPLHSPREEIPVTVHQSKVFAGATMIFVGQWFEHPKYGRQFKALQVQEKRPATIGALEKYLGSGLIKGVGPKTAKRIVKHFGQKTLDIFEGSIERLREVQGIADLKLQMIQAAWTEHREIRNVMMFLQSHDISTLFAVKIYKIYGNSAIEKVQQDPYQLARDIYGIGFFSADKVAQSLGFALDCPQRVQAAIKHVISSGREEGHCYLTIEQIKSGVEQLIAFSDGATVEMYLGQIVGSGELKMRQLHLKGVKTSCYYTKTLYFDEHYVAKKIKSLAQHAPTIEETRVKVWIQRYCTHNQLQLSEEQASSVYHAVSNSFSILTGGPGCGKTTTTKVIVALYLAMGKQVLLAAPTGRAAQRMGEVIGLAAKTIHRLLTWSPQVGGFKKKEDNPLEGDVLIVDECSMLDISLTAGLLKAVPQGMQVLFIGDSDQLPSVGAGNVLKDLIDSQVVPCFRLTKVFRQSRESLIIKFAHELNRGLTPQVDSPFRDPSLWQQKIDCMFIDSEEMTLEQARFIYKAKHFLQKAKQQQEHKENKEQQGGETLILRELTKERQKFEKIGIKEDGSLYSVDVSPEMALLGNSQRLEPDFTIPKKFRHIQLEELTYDRPEVEELKTVLSRIHPWSTLHFGKTATEMIINLLKVTIPKYYSPDCEVQVLSPMTRGSLGTMALNQLIQQEMNPLQPGSAQVQMGHKTFRPGDRVIQKRNNYDLGVFNGDIGYITNVDSESMQCIVNYTNSSEGAKEVVYERENLTDLDLAYAITIHKSQGSEFAAVIIPVTTQHFKMLFRNLIYTALTRARLLAIFVGTRRAFTMSVKNVDSRVRQTALKVLLQKVETLEKD